MSKAQSGDEAKQKIVAVQIEIPSLNKLPVLSSPKGMHQAKDSEAPKK